MRAETASTIENIVGILEEVEDPIIDGMLMSNFLRFKVAIDITKPLQIDFWMARDHLPKTWISFKYEHLQDTFCLNCGIIDHDKRRCKNQMAMSIRDPNEPRYTKELSTSHVRALVRRSLDLEDKSMTQEVGGEAQAHGIQIQQQEKGNN
ncbi:hypothetical protein AHAS_Ahas19G0271400 [Arachis hypogaea]